VQSAVGFVPYENLIGRASFIFFSTDGSASLAEVWKWPFAIRYGRIFDSIAPVRPPEDKAAHKLTRDAHAATP
jgi:signal peptidase I